jgi:glycosyltransferase involved in cell wall biosynthesis
MTSADKFPIKDKDHPWRASTVSLFFNVSPSPKAPLLSIIIPAYNEARNLPMLSDRLTPSLVEITEEFEVIIINDGSADETAAQIAALHQHDPRYCGLSFSRNFGKEIAIAAGLDHARGQACVIIDADLQHPPEIIAKFVEKWREGYQVVYGQRIDRATDSALRKTLSEWFYKVFSMAGETPLPPGAGDFRLLDRKAVQALRAMGERARFSKGLYAWVGFRCIGVPFEVAERAHGVSSFNLHRLFSFAFDGITSFSTLPLKLWIYIGFIISFMAFLTGSFYLTRTLLFGVDVPGYASLIVSIMFFAGMQLLSLGIIGEYIGRIFAEVKRRPLYIIGERFGIEADPNDVTPPPFSKTPPTH